MLWNTCCTNAAVAQLRGRDYPADDADAARLSPLGDHHLNVRGRYTFIRPRAPPLANPLPSGSSGDSSSSARPA